VQLLHVKPSEAQRLYAEQPKQGQFRLPCGYGWWQEKENWLIARMKTPPAWSAGGLLSLLLALALADDQHQPVDPLQRSIGST
jgi:hypothetical protein